MQVQTSPSIIADYLQMLDEVRINRDYQRSGGVWPTAAKSALIETLILGLPMPAMYLHQRYNAETRRPYKELVDGQQRTETIQEFAEGRLRLSRVLATERLRGRRFDELEEGDHQAFMSYSLPLFLFIGATDSDVREAFRRINSFNATLNPEEKRHATYHGAFKWFIHELAAELAAVFISLSVLSRPQVIRMKDTALVADIVSTCLKGVRTTKSREIDLLYEEYDRCEEFPGEAEVRDQVLGSILRLSSWSWLPATGLNKAYQFMLLVVAIIHAESEREALREVVTGGDGLLPEDQIRQELSLMGAALDDPSAVEAAVTLMESAYTDSSEEDEEETEDASTVPDLRLARFADFVAASGSATNTLKSRKLRFRELYRAVTGR